jgi:ABC-type branched-subunit amino acid transport system substrate-binding protein
VMASQVIGIAGGLGNADGGGVDVVQAENIPVVATASADSFQALPQVFDINPPFADIHAETAKFRWLYDQGVRTAALVYIDAAQVKSQVEQQRAQMEAVGIRIVLDRPVPLSTLSYDTHARAVANSKADYLFYPAAGNLNAAMARSMEDTGYKLKFGEYLTAYGSNFIELAGSAAEGAVSFARALPTEEAASNPEATAFVQWMGRVAPGVAADTFAADAWASAKAFVDNLDALPGPISREALIAQLRTVETYDAAGFFGPIQLGAKRSNGCVIGMRVVSGQWQRIVPQRGFLC